MTNEPFKVGDLIKAKKDHKWISSLKSYVIDVLKVSSSIEDIIFEVTRDESRGMVCISYGGIFLEEWFAHRFYKCHPIINCDGDDDDCI